MFEISNKKFITNQLSSIEEISILLVRAVLFVLWKFSDQRKPSVSPQWKLVLINNLLFTNSSLQLCKFKQKNHKLFPKQWICLEQLKKGPANLLDVYWCIKFLAEHNKIREE